MSESKENPKIWVFPGRTFMDYSTKKGAYQNYTHRRLSLDVKRKGDNKTRGELLEENGYCAP